MQYFENDKNLKSEKKEINIIVRDEKFSFLTDNGVFSKRGLDFGTRTLLENIENVYGDVLDLGCGYGPIGIILKKFYDVNVDMVDVNLRSLRLAQENAKINKANVLIFESNTYEKITKTYDFIVTNPPIRIGKKKLYEILFEAKNHLKKDGQLWFVINKNQGAKSVFEDLKEDYQVKIITKNKGFFVICAYK